MEHLSVSNAQHSVLEALKVLGTETVKLEHALARVLAQDIRANRDIPPYAVSAMDGYAVRSTDLAQPPATLTIIEDIKAGDLPSHTLQPGQCARIMTGAAMPAGADAVIRVEDTLPLSADSVQILVTTLTGHDVRARGESMGNGDVVLTAGCEITPGVIGVLATVKCAQVPVYCQPRVAILSTGDELEGMHDPVDPNKIPNSNSYALMAQVQALGIEPVLLGIARDDPKQLQDFIRRGLSFDVLLISGGSSVGVHDFVRPCMEALGVQMKFWRVAMKPGHPLAFGILPRATASSYVFGLPGNPVSSMVCFEQFVAPALRSMMGHTRLFRRTLTARLSQQLAHRPGRSEFIRVVLSRDDTGYVASPTGLQGSGMLLSMARADGLMSVPAASEGLAAGTQVTVQLLDGTTFQDEFGVNE